MWKYRIYIWGVCALLIGCSTKDIETLKLIKEYNTRKVVFDPNIKYCLVLPEVGCG